MLRHYQISSIASNIFQNIEAPPTNQTRKSIGKLERASESFLSESNVQTVFLPGGRTLQAHEMAKTNPVTDLGLAVWQAPIEFYGKVVNESNNALSGANIKFHWVETPTEEGNRTTNKESDVNGLFSLQGQLGPQLSVSISKDGYYAPHRGLWGFTYALGPDIYTPVREKPIIFTLRKKGNGVPLVTSKNGITPTVGVRVPRDNSPVKIDFFQKKATPNGQLEISQNKPMMKDATEWSFRLRIVDGGFVENQDDYEFEAPETNYRPIIEYHFKKGETNWTSHFDGKYYIAFGQPRKYGWIHFESSLSQETVFITYAINPTGSRNLEPIEDQPLRPQLPPGVTEVIPNVDK